MEMKTWCITSMNGLSLENGKEKLLYTMFRILRSFWGPSVHGKLLKSSKETVVLRKKEKPTNKYLYVGF